MSAEVAHDGQQLLVPGNDADWLWSWHPPNEVPVGRDHGATGVCLCGGGLVLISHAGTKWALPGGRPDDGESWDETLVREVREEACARVLSATLLGFGRGVCISGPDKGLELVRSQWRADVELGAWKPEHEVLQRRVVPASEWRSYMWIDEGWMPFLERLFLEALSDSRS